MNRTSLLDIQPKELQFVCKLKENIECQIQLINTTYHHVAYKVKTTALNKYCVRPNMGIIMPKSTYEFVTVTMQAQQTILPDMVCDDKFLIESTIVPSWTTKEDLKNPNMFSNDEGKFIEVEKFKVALLNPPTSPSDLQSIDNCRTKLLNIEPKQLRFIFELKKRMTCQIQLANNTRNHVAYKVKTTSPNKYCVRPVNGIIGPKSTCEFTVTMQAQKTVPADMTCRDKFLIQSTVVPSWTTTENITPIMFSKDEGNDIEEEKLNVALLGPKIEGAAHH